MSVKVGNLTFEAALDNPQLIASPIKDFLENWDGVTAKEEILVAEINPKFSDSLAFCNEYDIPLTQGANCLIIEGQRGTDKKYAACLVPINTRANINSIVRKHLDVRRASLAPKDLAVNKSAMEYGSITVVGLPFGWQLLIDESLVSIPYLVIGGGLRKSKLLIPGKFLWELPKAIIIQGLATKLSE